MKVLFLNHSGYVPQFSHNILLVIDARRPYLRLLCTRYTDKTMHTVKIGKPRLHQDTSKTDSIYCNSAMWYLISPVRRAVLLLHTIIIMSHS